LYIDFGKYALFIGEMLLKAGRYEEAKDVIDTCFQRLETFETMPWKPPLHCLRGDLILAMDGPQGDAEEAYRQSEELARSQGARSWLLRTAMSQARLLNRQGKTSAARHKLKEIYDTFTEGFDTADLVAARKLLENLGES
jgi:predicted ATPase